jgi:hypothetical protein
VIKGGLIAGLVFNIGEYVFNGLLMGERWAEALGHFNLPEPSGVTTCIFVVMNFVLGIATVGVYGAIRPRYGAGPKTAICAAMSVWFFVWVFGFMSTALMGFYPIRIAVIACLWGLIEAPLAALAGCRFYQED